VSRNLHLLEVGLQWPPETFVKSKLAGLAERGFRVTVAADGFSETSDQELAGVELVRLPRFPEFVRWPPARRASVGEVVRASAGLARFAGDDPAAARRLVEAVRRPELVARWRRTLRRDVGRLISFLPLAGLRPDVVHFEWEERAIAYDPLVHVWRCPVVVSCHGGGIRVRPHSPRFEHIVRAYPELFARADAVHCASEAIAAEAERYGLDRRRAWVIHQGVDPSVFAPPNAPRRDDETLRVVAVGRLVWEKGFEFAVQAIWLLVDGGVPVSLDILGGPPGQSGDQARIRHAIADLGLERHVRLLGQVSSLEVRDRLRRADAFLHASVSEGGLPTVVVEALACGLPVVAADTGGVGELVTDGKHGFVVPRRDPGALAAGLRRLREDPALRERMGRAGRERVLAGFTVDRQLDSFVELYEHVTAAGRVQGVRPVPEIKVLDPTVSSPANAHRVIRRSTYRGIGGP
jgi:glycosyltransferase involved in cell wall biosynthesis